MRPLRYRPWWTAVGFATVALVVYLSLTPDPVDAGRMGEVKTGHFIAYGWLGLWFFQLCRSAGSRIAAALSLVVLGVALEYAQLLTGYRTFAFVDMRDNALGVIAGAALAFTPLGRMIAIMDEHLARRIAR